MPRQGGWEQAALFFFALCLIMHKCGLGFSPGMGMYRHRNRCVAKNCRARMQNEVM